MSGQLVLKSQNAVSDISDLPDIQYYIARVEADGGVINNRSELLEAFAFFYSSGVGSDKVVSATNPSWGIKKTEAGVVTKLYSLFGVIGDIVFATSGTIKPLYDTTNNFPSVYFGGSVSCYGKLSGVFNVQSSVAIVTVNAVPTGVPYGESVTMPIGIIWSEKNYVADGASSTADYITVSRAIFRSAPTNTDPSTWWNSVAQSALTIGNFSVAPNVKAKPIAAHLSVTSGLDIVTENGAVANRAASANNTRRLSDLTFLLGVSVSASGAASGAAVSHFFENWVVRDITIAQTQIFTKRVSTKYYNKV